MAKIVSPDSGVSDKLNIRDERDIRLLIYLFRYAKFFGLELNVG